MGYVTLIGPIDGQCCSVPQTDADVTTQIGYAPLSTAYGSQVHDLQSDAPVAIGVEPEHIHEDTASGRLDERLIFVGLAEFEREPGVQHTRAVPASARVHGPAGRSSVLKDICLPSHRPGDDGQA